jgi:hypothetical protein
MRVRPCDQRMFGRILRNWRRQCQGLPEEVRNLVTFKAVGGAKTEVSVTEYDWPVGHVMEMSKMGMQQCLNKMAAIFGNA